MRLYARQKLLLSLVDAAGGSLAATDLQKLLFLYTRKGEKEPSYRFVPYRFGCFSFQSYADRNVLESMGLLEPSKSGDWTLTAKAKPYVPAGAAKALKLFVTVMVPERGRSLIQRVYREAPYYATRSRILEEVFPDEAQREEIRREMPRMEGRALFTIGYEGDSIDGYLDRLIRHGVTLLCDVRRNPLSRKTGFSGKQLAGYCQRVGIEYRHLPELGIPGHRRRELNTPADYEALFEEYEREDLPQAGGAIATLAGLLEEHGRIALTCFEKEPEYCHRHCVAEEMVRRHAACPAPRHI